MNYFQLALLIFCGISIGCQSPKKPADLLIFNAKVYTVNDSLPHAEGFAVKDGKFLELGDAATLMEKYTFTEMTDAGGKAVIPGIIDAHCHFYNLGLQQQQVDLTGTQSYAEVLKKIMDFQMLKKVSYITGRGWDQNDWEHKEFPTKKGLDSLFPNTPVAVTRVDGHAMLVNQAALDQANITVNTKVMGGEILQENGELTGVLIDNPMELIERTIPKPTLENQIMALKDAQEINFQYGLTTVDDAGLSPQVIALIDSLQQTKDLKIRMYVMVSNTPAYVETYLKKGVVKNDYLNVSSFKVYADGALGSRGAVLKEPYSDKENHFGAMVIGVDEFKELAKKIAASEFQMNTHAIGDSANAVVLKTFTNVLKEKTDRRWRVEHAQVLSLADIQALDDNIVMSVQPTHATSDMYWAEDRLGTARMKGAYAYKTLLEKTGKLALGTDYPVEAVNPFYTFYAAVARKDLQNFPEGGFQKEEALTRMQALKGMTIWAAFANFEEEEKGSIAPGKFADFVILKQDIMTVEEDQLPKTEVEATYLAGEKVF